MILHRAASVILLLIAPGLLSCGGGGGGSGVVTPGPVPSVVASFTADQPSPGANTVSLAQAPGSGGGGLLTLTLNVSGVDDLNGVSFDLLYDPTHVHFVDYAEGSALEAGGTVFYSLSANQAGRLVVGIALVGGSAVNVTATTPVIRLTFQVDAAGSSTLSFSGNDLSDSALNSIPGIGWFAGTIVAN